MPTKSLHVYTCKHNSAVAMLTSCIENHNGKHTHRGKHLGLSKSVNVHKGALYMYMVLVMYAGGKFILLLRYSSALLSCHTLAELAARPLWTLS